MSTHPRFGAPRCRLDHPRRSGATQRLRPGDGAGLDPRDRGRRGGERGGRRGRGRQLLRRGALGQLGEPDPAQLRQLFTTSARLLDAVRACPRPVIAAVDGPAAGGGNELVVACDFAIATERSTFGQTGPKVGSAPVLGATNCWPCRSASAAPKRWRCCAAATPPRRRSRWGLVNEVVPDDGLDEAVERWLDEIEAAQPPLPRDRQDQLQPVVAPVARQHGRQPRRADPGDRQRGHAGGRPRLPGEAQARLPRRPPPELLTREDP